SASVRSSWRNCARRRTWGPPGSDDWDGSIIGNTRACGKGGAEFGRRLAVRRPCTSQGQPSRSSGAGRNWFGRHVFAATSASEPNRIGFGHSRGSNLPAGNKLARTLPEMVESEGGGEGRSPPGPDAR